MVTCIQANLQAFSLARLSDSKPHEGRRKNKVKGKEIARDLEKRARPSLGPAPVRFSHPF